MRIRLMCSHVVGSLLLAFVFFANGAVHGDTQTLRLSPGFNFIGITVKAPGLDSRALMSRCPALVGVYRYDAGGRRYVGQISVGAGDFDGEPLELRPGIGYVMRASGEAAIDISGEPVAIGEDHPVRSGFAIPAGKTTSYELMNRNPEVTGVYRFDPISRRYISHLHFGGDDFEGEVFG